MQATHWPTYVAHHHQVLCLNSEKQISCSRLMVLKITCVLVALLFYTVWNIKPLLFRNFASAARLVAILENYCASVVCLQSRKRVILVRRICRGVYLATSFSIDLYFLKSKSPKSVLFSRYICRESHHLL